MLNIALIEPEIPMNTGNISRTCAVTGSRLHLVRPLGFNIDDRSLKRAGLDYWHLLDLRVYGGLDEFLKLCGGATLWFCTTKAKTTYAEVSFNENDFLVFGKETAGLPSSLLEAHPERCIRIPMRGEARSLNLSNSVSVILYEALRQLWFPQLI